MEAKVNKQTNNNNTSANNKQTNKQRWCTCGGSVELRSDGVQCAMHQSTRKGFGDVLEIHGKASEVSEIHWKRHEGWSQVVL